MHKGLDAVGDEGEAEVVGMGALVETVGIVGAEELFDAFDEVDVGVVLFLAEFDGLSNHGGYSG